MILLLRGGDELGIRRRLQHLKDEADGGTGMLTTNLVQIDGRQATANEILAAVLTPPFLAPRRLTIVEGFLDRWERRQAPREEGDGGATPDREAGPPGSEARGARITEFEPFFAAVEAGLPESAWLVLTGGEPQATNAMVARLKKIGTGVTEEVLSEPRREALPRFIRDEAAARGVRFRASRAAEEHWDSEDWVRRPENDPIALLAAITNGNTLAIANELDKLALYTMGRDVTVDDIYTLCSGEREITQFNLLDAIQDGKVAEALGYLDRLMAADDVTQYVITMLTTRFRQTAIVAELMEAGASDEEVGRAMGNAGRYEGLRRAGMNRARRIGSEGARAALIAIADCDYRSKKGDVESEVALEALVTRLARMAAAGDRAGGRR